MMGKWSLKPDKDMAGYLTAGGAGENKTTVGVEESHDRNNWTPRPSKDVMKYLDKGMIEGLYKSVNDDYEKTRLELNKKAKDKALTGIENAAAAVLSPAAVFVGIALLMNPFAPSDWRGYGLEKFTRDVKPFFEAFYRAPLDIGDSIKTATYDKLKELSKRNRKLSELRDMERDILKEDGEGAI